MELSDFEKIKENWDAVLTNIKGEFVDEILDVSYKMWIQPLKPGYMKRDEDGNQILYIEVPDTAEFPGSVYQRLVSRKYTPYIRASIQIVTGVICRPEFYVRETAKKDPELINRPRQVAASTLVASSLNPRYTFDNFVVGKNNQFAHAVALAVAEAPGEAYNPLFIYGGVGLGKTHLMQSIAHSILQKNPETKILYVTSETFTNELIESIRNRDSYSTAQFRNKYRNIDVLLIDDIQFIIGKESTQEEFFHTFNALYEAKKQIIISSDKPPKDFATLEERLRSRFEWGVPVDIQSPDYETRVAILRKKEELDGFNIDNEVIQYIAANIRSNIRELEGSLNRIVAMSRLNNREINLEMAQEILKDMINPEDTPALTPDFIIQMVADHYGISEADLKGQKRNKEIAYPRQIAMYLCREMTDTSLQQIGSVLGNRDHSTVIHGLDKVSTDLKRNPELETQISALKKKINAH